MKTLGNVLWLVLGGLWLALGYLFAALLMALLVITIPFAIAALRMAAYVIWPFGRTVVSDPRAGAPSLVGNVLWFLLAGWWIAIGHAGWLHGAGQHHRHVKAEQQEAKRCSAVRQGIGAMQHQHGVVAVGLHGRDDLVT